MPTAVPGYRNHSSHTAICTRKTAVASPPSLRPQSFRPVPGRNPHASLHVAVLDEELPFPLTSGKRIRTFNLLARLADRHRVTILCHRNPDRDEVARRRRRVPRARHRDGRRRSRRAAEVRAGVLRPARGQPALAAALLGRHARQPGARRRRSHASPRRTRSICGTASGRPTPRCCATRSASGSPRRAGA